MAVEKEVSVFRRTNFINQKEKQSNTLKEKKKNPIDDGGDRIVIVSLT